MKTRRTPRWLMLGLLTIAALILSGCSGASPVLGASWPGLTVSADTIYLSYGKVYAINPDDSTAKWSFPEPPNQLASNQAFFAPPAVADQLVVVTDYTDSMFGLNPADGTQKWIFKSNRSRFIGGPVMGDKLVYAASADGVVHAVPRDNQGATAQEAWSFTTEGSIWATPLLADGTLYVTSMDKHVYAIDAETGKLQWKYPDETSAPENPPMGGIVGTPTLHKGVLYFGSFNNRLYALDIQTRKVLWRYPTTNWVWGSPVVDDTTGYIIAADLSGQIFAIDPASGTPDKPVWTVNAKASVVGAPVLRMMSDGTPVVYVTSGGDPTQPELPNLFVLNVKGQGSNVSPLKTKIVKFDFPNKFLGLIDTGPPTPRTIKLYPAPVFTGDTLLLASHEGDNALYEFDSNTLAAKGTPVSLKDVDTKLQAAKAPPGSDQQGGLFGTSPLNTLLLITAVFLLVSLVLRPAKGGKK